ncbi:IS21 family transposase [Cytobacillus firmus]|uniref:IS21 family transposase n=1 Tax=Cytobacillus firmus TaxID=1399 RepID=UPI00077CB44D|nr:IS21 family transposase [Cytobacillus firmus]MBG9541698.1 integrase [Cytobacillus firmus]MBG9543902.1 integrase [Cytobacillus firmus]MBG9543912.1 integrase [Cytobacillus firmus]MBG9543934.1 integrase [Cytobacillus firmus]MBG9546116.1 integrase [Cytobacillus firmus]
MVKYREILRLHAQEVTQRGIASSCGHSRNTIREVIRRAEEKNIQWPIEKGMTDQDLQMILFPEKKVPSDHRRKPDGEYIHKELAKTGVTLSLLWDEYSLQCRANDEIPYSYRQFCRFYNDYARKTKATMRIKRKPGEQMEVDWAGQTMHITNNLTGEEAPVYIFVSALPCSQYAYVEGFLSMDVESWITAHIHAFEFYGGVTRIIVPDNLKTGVTKSSRTDPIINQSYQEMAEFYQTTIIPARVRHPKDKPSVEGNVGHISTWIIASLRNEKFFSLIELNKAIKEKLDVVNTKPFQKRKGNRQEAFLEEERFALIPLPHSPYEIASWAKTVVQPDYHIKVDYNYYSVPYDYIKYVVDVRVTRTIIEVFYKNIRIASHKRSNKSGGDFSTIPDHMPRDHRKYASFDKEFILEWGATTGPATLLTIERILESYPTEKQGLKSAYALMKLADKYSIERIEKACERVLSYTPRPKLKSIQTILKTGHDKLPVEDTSKQLSTQKNDNVYGFTRGADYYGGNNNDN